MNNRVAILSAFTNANYDTGNPALMQLVDCIRCYHYPNRGENPRSNIAGLEGDPIYIQIPFRIETAAVNGIRPTLRDVAISVVATKANEDDFVVEKFTFNVPECRLNDQQTVNFLQTRGYITYDGDPYNSISLSNDSANNSGTKKAFMLQYGLVLRYDYWNTILTANIGGQSCDTDINNNIQNVNNSWSNLATQGWSLKARVNANVVGYDNTITPFQAETSITCKALGTLPDVGPAYACEIFYYDESAIIVPSPIVGGKTRIRAKFTNNGTAVPDPFDSFWGSMFSDLLSGGPTARRFASTEYASESDSPFSDGGIQGDVIFAADGTQALTAGGEAILSETDPITDESNGNIRIATYEDGTIVLETIYDDSITQWGLKDETIIISPRLGFKVVNVMQTAGGEDALTAGGQQIVL